MQTDSTSPSERPRLALLVYPGFSEYEVAVALTLLAEKYTVVSIGLSTDPVRGEGGLLVTPEQALTDIHADGFEVALIPGAGDFQCLVGISELNTFFKDMHTQGKVLGAICGGPFVLGQAGVLENVPYTASLTMEQRAFLKVLPEAQFEYSDVVRSGNIITAQGHAFVKFGLALAEALGTVNNMDETRKFYGGSGNTLMEQDMAGV